MGATSTRNTRELLITALLAVLGAVLTCGWIWLAKRSPEDSLAASITRVFLHRGLPQPVSGNALVAFVAALPAASASGLRAPLAAASAQRAAHSSISPDAVPQAKRNAAPQAQSAASKKSEASQVAAEAAALTDS